MVLTDATARSAEQALERVTPGVELSFCTNPMLDRGRVYHCVVDDRGHAIVQKQSNWWAMSYQEVPIDRDADLGEVRPYMISGTLLYGLQAGPFREGRG